MMALKKLLQGERLTYQDAWDILAHQSDWSEAIEQEATKKRQAAYGNQVYIRGLIELSSFCKQDCYYCGLRRSNSQAQRYRLDDNTVLHQAAQGYDLGVRTFVLQGGEDAYFQDDRLVPLVKKLRERYPDAAITLSLGERSRESYRQLKEAGADRYLLRHETADAMHYRQLHPSDMSWETRRDALHALKDLGFQTGAGMMVGSPGQTSETLAKDLLFLQELRPQMVGIGPFIQAADTPFAEAADGDVELTLYLLNICRLLLPDALIPATTALATKDESARIRALKSSANVLMPNLTPAAQRDSYAIYADKKAVALEAIEGLQDLKQTLALNHLELNLSRGDYKELTHVQST